MPVMIVVVAALGLLVVLFSVTDKSKTGRVQFFAKGKDAGFSFKEIELLHRLAMTLKLEDPTSLFFSQNQLDDCIKSLVRTMKVSGFEGQKEHQDFLSKLYDYRKKIEMDRPQVKHGISNSRQISDGQNLRVLVEGTGVFRSQVIKNTTQYLTISRPVSGKLSGTFSWQGQKLSIYFWRDEDAGYVFDSVVTDEVFSKGIASLKVSHVDSLFRTQKRKSIRLKMHKSAYLYPIINEADANALEVNPGVKCFLEDLSDSGCAVTIGGKALPDMRLKVQFSLNNYVLCMSGTVRSVDYKEDLHRSLLHVESDPLPIETRNQILGEVFGMLPEDEEDLPFRLLGEEAAGMSAGSASERDGPNFTDEDSDSAGFAV